MVQMLNYAKLSRIINSMTLKALLLYFEEKGGELDIQAIQKEVEKSVK